MRNRHQVIAFLCVFIASGSALAASPIGNTVQASTTVSASGRTLQKSSPLFLNDVLRSNATGLGQFIFDDGTRLAMGPSASLTIDRSIYKGKSVQRAGIQASKGAFRYISGASSGHKVVTPYGHIGIRGTAFDFTIRNGRVYVLLFRGSVDFCTARVCKTLRRGCDYFVAGGGRVSDPQPLSAGPKSGLNVAQIFPLAANQNRLGSRFRQAGGACIGRSAQRMRDSDGPTRNTQRTISRPEPPSEPPSEPPGEGGGGVD